MCVQLLQGVHKFLSIKSHENNDLISWFYSTPSCYIIESEIRMELGIKITAI
jgi:hypothetical protein